MLAEVDNHGPGLLRRQNISVSDHAQFRKALDNAAGNRLVILAVFPGVIEQRGADRPFQAGSVTDGAVLEVELRGAIFLGRSTDHRPRQQTEPTEMPDEPASKPNQPPKATLPCRHR